MTMMNGYKNKSSAIKAMKKFNKNSYMGNKAWVGFNPNYSERKKTKNGKWGKWVKKPWVMYWH